MKKNQDWLMHPCKVNSLAILKYYKANANVTTAKFYYFL